MSKVRGMIDGAVRDAFNMHPEYLSPKVCPVTVRNSIVKRVAGALRETASPKGEGLPQGD